LSFDVLAVRQIIRNLVENAVKFTSRGLITIEAKWIPSAQNGGEGEVVMSVTDTGIGIAEKDVERIFEPFTQLESSMSRRYGGTGLGLSISRSLAENMGGTLTATSKPGAGSRFEVRFPAQDVTAEEHRKQIKQKAAEPATGPVLKRILLAEDSQD